MPSANYANISNVSDRAAHNAGSLGRAIGEFAEAHHRAKREAISDARHAHSMRRQEQNDQLNRDYRARQEGRQDERLGQLRENSESMREARKDAAGHRAIRTGLAQDNAKRAQNRESRAKNKADYEESQRGFKESVAQNRENRAGEAHDLKKEAAVRNQEAHNERMDSSGERRRQARDRHALRYMQESRAQTKFNQDQEERPNKIKRAEEIHDIRKEGNQRARQKASNADEYLQLAKDKLDVHKGTQVALGPWRHARAHNELAKAEYYNAQAGRQHVEALNKSGGSVPSDLQASMVNNARRVYNLGGMPSHAPGSSPTRPSTPVSGSLAGLRSSSPVSDAGMRSTGRPGPSMTPSFSSAGASTPDAGPSGPMWPKRSSSSLPSRRAGRPRIIGGSVAP